MVLPLLFTTRLLPIWTLIYVTKRVIGEVAPPSLPTPISIDEQGATFNAERADERSAAEPRLGYDTARENMYGANTVGTQTDIVNTTSTQTDGAKTNNTQADGSNEDGSTVVNEAVRTTRTVGQFTKNGVKMNKGKGKSAKPKGIFLSSKSNCKKQMDEDDLKHPRNILLKAGDQLGPFWCCPRFNRRLKRAEKKEVMCSWERPFEQYEDNTKLRPRAKAKLFIESLSEVRHEGQYTCSCEGITTISTTFTLPFIPSPPRNLNIQRKRLFVPAAEEVFSFYCFGRCATPCQYSWSWEDDVAVRNSIAVRDDVVEATWSSAVRRQLTCVVENNWFSINVSVKDETQPPSPSSSSNPAFLAVAKQRRSGEGPEGGIRLQGLATDKGQAETDKRPAPTDMGRVGNESRGLAIVCLVILGYVVLIISIKLMTNHEEVRLFFKVLDCHVRHRKEKAKAKGQSVEVSNSSAGGGTK